MSRPYRVDPEDCLAPFDELENPTEPLRASEVADAVGIARRTAHKKLEELVERGELESKALGERMRVWYRPYDAVADASRDTSRDTAEMPQDRSAPDRDHPAAAPLDETDRVDVQEIADAINRDAIRDNLPGSGDRLEARVDAILDIYQYLRDQAGQIRTTSELKDRVDADAVGYNTVDSFWSNAVKANSDLDRENALTSLPGVEELGNGRYRYTHAE